jgi:hypothetical protein
MRCLSDLFCNYANRLFRQARRPARTRLELESLEDRVVMNQGVANSTALILQGAAGTVRLTNRAQLIFTNTATQATTTLETIASSFNVDGKNNLFELNEHGMLWELPSGADPTIVGSGGWVLLDNNVGSMDDGGKVLAEIKKTGVLWELPASGNPSIIGAGGWIKLDLNPGAPGFGNGFTRAAVDTAGNVYAMRFGNLIEWTSTGQLVGILNNTSLTSNGVTGNLLDDVVSFALGGNTVAWQLGYQDPLAGDVVVSYTNGTNPAALTVTAAGTTNAQISAYDVDAGGFLFVRATNAAVNTGVAVLSSGGAIPSKVANVDAGLDVQVQSKPNSGTSFSISPDGTVIGVLDTTNRNLSAWRTAEIDAAATPAVISLREIRLDTAVNTTANSALAVSNDLNVYEYNNAAAGIGGTLVFYNPLGGTPTMATTVGTGIQEWELGPNGMVDFLTTPTAATPSTLTLGTQAGAQTFATVSEFRVADDGELYYLTTAGGLFQGLGNNAMGAAAGTFNLSMIDTNAAAIEVNFVSALLEVKDNGNVWLLTGSPSDVFNQGAAEPAPVGTKFVGWVWLFTNATLTGAPVTGTPETGTANGTLLYTLPDGDFFFLMGNGLIQLTANRFNQWTQGTTGITADIGVPGVIPNRSAFNPWLQGGLNYSRLITLGLNPANQIGPILL